MPANATARASGQRADGEMAEIKGAADGPEERPAAGGGVEALADRGRAGGVFLAQHENVGAGESAAWLAEVSAGEEMVVEVGGGDEDDIDVAGELAMLEAVVEQEDCAGAER